MNWVIGHFCNFDQFSFKLFGASRLEPRPAKCVLHTDTVGKAVKLHDMNIDSASLSDQVQKLEDCQRSLPRMSSAIAATNAIMAKTYHYASQKHAAREKDVVAAAKRSNQKQRRF